MPTGQVSKTKDMATQDAAAARDVEAEGGLDPDWFWVLLKHAGYESW